MVARQKQQQLQQSWKPVLSRLLKHVADERAGLQAHGFRKINSARRAIQKPKNRSQLDMRTNEALHEFFAEPKHYGVVGRIGAYIFTGTPGMRNSGAYENQVSIFVRSYVVAHETLAAAVERQGKFIFAVVVPFERDRGKPPVKQRPGAVLRGLNTFQVGLHGGTLNRRILSLQRFNLQF